ncbi:MAG: hypothetical protein QOE90_3263 [Thermoplasmata archaeon]|jgi:hypothetical protein|nr:hypothetical protein [Thermoplasmata archaeon]
MPTVSLRGFPPPLRLEIEPLARLHADGWLELLGPGFPPTGACMLVLWRPDERPAFVLHRARVRGGRAEPGAEGWVVAWGVDTGASA